MQNIVLYFLLNFSLTGCLRQKILSWWKNPLQAIEQSLPPIHIPATFSLTQKLLDKAKMQESHVPDLLRVVDAKTAAITPQAGNAKSSKQILSVWDGSEPTFEGERAIKNTSPNEEYYFALSRTYLSAVYFGDADVLFLFLSMDLVKKDYTLYIMSKDFQGYKLVYQDDAQSLMLQYGGSRINVDADMLRIDEIEAVSGAETGAKLVELRKVMNLDTL